MKSSNGNIFDSKNNFEKFFWILNLRKTLIFSLIFLFFIFYILNIDLYNTSSTFYLLVWQFVSLILNFLFYFYLKHLEKNQHALMDDEQFKYIGLLQIDFDIVYTIITILLSGGIKSPLIFLFIYNILTLTFIIQDKNSFFYMFLLFLLMFISEFKFSFKQSFPYVEYVPLERIGNILLIFLIYLFLFYMSKYISDKLNQKQDELNELYRKTYKLSITDRLTGLYDQTYFKISATDALNIAKFNGNKLALVMFDIDNFKEFNDTNGHLMGSRALIQIADIMRKSFRKTDILGKYGGDEFIILLKDIDEDYILFVLERFKQNIQNHNFKPENSGVSRLTISMGVSFFPKDGDDVETLIDKADKALYIAKNVGKNFLVIFNDG